jgi:hypothetical protein
MRRTFLALLCVAFLAVRQPARADAPRSDYEPDPASVERYGPAYRYPQDGWIVLHIEGQPYERGYQHGRLLAAEIAAYVRCLAAALTPGAPQEGWQHTRKLANALWLRRFEREFLEEMKGIADGAAEAGVKIYGRPVDLADIVALNCWPELETLGSALEATPTGLEGLRFPHAQPRAMPRPRPEHCSAFVATGPATADGKVVFGHITMFSLYPSNFYNVWIDIKPARGRRVLICGYPGAMQSGMDYYMNDAGILIAETTISQTRFDVRGMSEASRIRQAIQYAESIDQVVAILSKDNNGLYTNEWLLADVNTNEIALFELGTHKSRLHRSSKNEWIGGTTGFYWGCNNTKDIALRLETIPGVQGRPRNLVLRPSNRDQAWQRLYHKHKGKISVAFAKEAFTTPPIAAYHSLDAKFTTSDMAKNLQSWALFGPPLRRTWQPTPHERRIFPEIKPLVSNPWTILHAHPPAKPVREIVAVDLPHGKATAEGLAGSGSSGVPLLNVPAWHGTILPETDGDVWLATAFANYERIVAREKQIRGSHKDGELAQADRDELARALLPYRSDYLIAVRRAGDVPLTHIKSEWQSDNWYRLAAGKGILVLHELRRYLGDSLFDEAMESFGREHAGRKVTTSQFQNHLEQKAGRRLDWFFDSRVRQAHLPQLRFGKINSTRPVSASDKSQVRVEGELFVENGGTGPRKVDVTVETDQGEITKTLDLDSPRTPFRIDITAGAPRRVVLDKYGHIAHAHSPAYAVTSFQADPEHSLIVYGTAYEEPTNREAAEALQKAIRESGANFTLPIKSDKDVTEDDVRTNHLLLIGRPDSNLLVQRFRKNLPVHFGSRSFHVRDKTYAHPGSAVVVAAENPLNKCRSLVVVAGLSAAATLHAAPTVPGQAPAEVVVLPNGASPRAFVLPAREMVRNTQP